MGSLTLSFQDYTWSNALCWGNFKAHCKRASSGTARERLAHIVIAVAEFLPIISQIASIFEMLIVKQCRSASTQNLIPVRISSPPLSALNAYQPTMIPEATIISTENQSKPKTTSQILLLPVQDVGSQVSSPTQPLVPYQPTMIPEATIISTENQSKPKTTSQILLLPVQDLGVQIIEKNKILKEQQSAFAIKVQSFWRGYCARKKFKKLTKPLLSHALFIKAKACIDVPFEQFNHPRAGCGRSIVYLPTQLPVVLKQGGNGITDSVKRFEAMKLAHALCEANNFKHIVVPHARIYRGFIIESRLPIAPHNTKEQIGMYLERQHEFTTAVEEFTSFLCQSDMSDIVGGTHDICHRLAKTELGRYDNLPLYFESGIGKIGLVDLERYSVSKASKYAVERRIVDAVVLFPLHFEQILNVARKFDPDIDQSRDELQQRTMPVLRGFKVLYNDHVDFLKTKGITKDHLVPEFDSEAYELVRVAIVEWLHHQNQKVFQYRGILGNDSEECLEKFNKIFPEILKTIRDGLSRVLKNRLAKRTAPITTTYELVAHRSLFLPHEFFQRKVNITPLLDMFTLKKVDWRSDLATELLRKIFTELAIQQQIAFFHKDYDTDYCIFL